MSKRQQLEALPGTAAEDPYHGLAPARFKCMVAYSTPPLCFDPACLDGCKRPNLRYGEAAKAKPQPAPPPPQEIPMDASDQTQLGKGAGARGRRDNDGQEAVLKPTTIKQKMAHLLKLHKAKEEASVNLSEAIKAVAKASGFNTAALKKFVKAKAGDEEQFKDAQRDAEQLQLLFDEVGE